MNSLELKKDPSGKFVTTIKCNGVESWELHREGLTDEAVLKRIKERNYYQHTKGDWVVTMPDEQKVFKDAKFDTAVGMAVAYIHERDHPCWEDHF
jgi:hypothetical protein